MAPTGVACFSEAPERAIAEVFDLTPAGIIRQLDLLRPIYRSSAAYGHFGGGEAAFTWERTDRAEALRGALDSKGALQ